MKYLAIDFGLKRMGFAVSSPDEKHAFALCTYHRTTRDALFEFILDLLEKEKIEALVIGLPLSLDGSETQTTAQVKNFTNSMKRRTSLPIYLINEALSSFEAEEALSHLSYDQRKKILDQEAARHILLSFLNFNNKNSLLQ